MSMSLKKATMVQFWSRFIKRHDRLVVWGETIKICLVADVMSCLFQEASGSVQQQAAILPGEVSSKDAPALQRFQRPSQ